MALDPADGPDGPESLTEVTAMAAKKHDRIHIDSDKAGKPAREGDILEVIEASYGTRYRVAWDDGHESTIRPAGGVAHIIPGKGQPTAHH